MKFPQLKQVNTYLMSRLALLIAGLFIFAATVPAQKTEANPSGNLDQCRNGSTGTDPCSGSNWVNGNVGAQNSQYSEDEYLPYRMTFSNLVPGPAGNPGTHVYTLVLGYDIIHGGKRAIDYLGSYNNLKITNRATHTASTRSVDPCSGVTGCSGWAQSTVPITTDSTVTGSTNPNTNGPVYQPNNQEFRMWGGTLISFAYTALNAGGGDTERQVTLTFTAQVANPVLAWSGHVAWRGDWGAGNSAGGISGSPYHMRFIGLDGQGGNQDRSLSADAVEPSGAVFIRKEVLTAPPDATNTANTLFPFSANSSFSPLAFTIVDSNPGPNSPSAPVASQSITAFGPGNAITVSELQSAGGPPGSTVGWDLINITCTETGLPNSTTNLLTATATIIVEEYEVVNCTFTNSQLQPTAAPASISGRVVSELGGGVRGVTITLHGLNSGEVRTVVTNTFGYYVFEGVPVEDYYVLTASHRKLTIYDNVRGFTLLEDLADVDFVVSP